MNHRILLSIVFVTLAYSPLFAQKRILILSWNVESGDNDPATIAQQLEDFEGYDLIGLTEVRASNADDYADAAGVGEGAKNSSSSDFRHRLSNSGRGNRMMIIWDNKRFDIVGQAQELDNLNDGNHRSPFFARFKIKGTQTEFLFMVNHLARGNVQLRRTQATGLSQWAAQQTVPVFAVGDYNFDYDIDEGTGNQAMQNMTTPGVWDWVRPGRLYQTQASRRFHSVLDFIFAAKLPSTWTTSSRILVNGFPSTDDNQRSDHRPVEGQVYVQ